jgi:transcriptional regulator with XRE-family HTH domain
VSRKKSDMTTSGIGSRIRELRGDKTQAAFAQIVGIPKNTIGRYEREEIQPGSDAIALLCVKTGTDPNWLLFGATQTANNAHGSKASDGASSTNASQEAPALRELSSEINKLKMENKKLRHEKNKLFGQLYERSSDPERDFVVSVVNLLGDPSGDWFTIKSTLMYTAAPVDIHKNGGFAVVPTGECYLPPGIKPEMLVFCDPSIEIRRGDIVYLEDNDNRATIRYLKDIIDKEEDQKIILHCQEPTKRTVDQNTKEMYIPASSVRKMVTVVYIKRRP